MCLTTQAQRPGPRGRSIATATLPPGSLQRMVGPSHIPLIKNSARTAQTDNNVPNVTGRNAASKAHHSIRPNGRCLRWSNKIVPPAKQIAGVSTTASIQNRGVADQSALNPLVAWYSLAASIHSPEQTSSAIESADVETRWPEVMCVVFIMRFDNPVQLYSRAIRPYRYSANTGFGLSRHALAYHGASGPELGPSRRCWQGTVWPRRGGSSPPS